MAQENGQPTEEELAIAAEKERLENEAKAKEPTDEEFEALVERRLGAKPKDLIKKEEQIKVLTEQEKREAEEKEQSEALKFGLDKQYVSKKEYDAYLELTASPKVNIARNKFIEQNKELGADAGKVFDRIIKLEEEDELIEGELTVENKEKKAAMAWAEKIADEEIEARYGRKIKALPEKYKAYLAEEQLKQKNTEVITKAITGIPNRIEIEVEGEKYGIEVSPEDYNEATAFATKEMLSTSDLTVEGVKATAASFILTRNVKRFVQEAATVAYQRGVDDTERGAKGIVPDKGVPKENSAVRDFLAKRDIHL